LVFFLLCNPKIPEKEEAFADRKDVEEILAILKNLNFRKESAMATELVKNRNSQDKRMVARLQEQLEVQKNVASAKNQAAEIHANVRKLTEYAFYPAHDKRVETPEYKAIHKKLVKELDLPCLICGVRNSTLKDKTKNTYGAKQLETHHHVVEWALANAISVDKFNATLLPHLKHKHPDKSDYQKREFTAKDIKNWVDHSEDNLWVLCDVHHRAQYLGIHEITDPIWGPQDLLKDDFEDYVRREIARAAKEKTKGAASKKGSSKKKKT
jgi:hypothetical protein